MSTAPIINVSNVAAGNSAVNKANGAGGSSDESFGQVLSREVNSRSDSGNSSSSSSTNGVGNAQGANSPTSTKSPSSSSSSGTASSGTSGKTGKTSSSTSSNANSISDPGTANSAQILALVTNVQPTGAGASGKAAASTTVGAIMASKGIAAPVSTSAITTAIPTDDSADVDATAAAAATATTQTTTDVGVKNANVATTVPQAVENDDVDTSVDEQAPATQSPITPQTTTETLTPVTIAAADKSIQSGVAALDNAMVKADQTVQMPQPTVVATAQQLTGTTQALNNAVSDNLSPQVGGAGWDQALSQKVVWMVAGGQQSASLTLNPPDLGPMQVVLNVTNSHATVTFTAAQPEVRQALETAMPKLREMLGDAGIQLGQASINSGSAQQQNTTSQQNSGNTHSGQSDNAIDPIGAISTAARVSPVSAGLGLVDTFA